MNKLNLLLSVAIVAVLTSCSNNDDKNDSPKPTLNVPTSYDSTGYGANTVAEAAVRTNLRSFVSEIQKGRSAANTLDATVLQSKFSNIKSLVPAAYASKVEGWIVDIAAASGKYYLPAATVTGEGGVYSTVSGAAYLFDETGIEPEQLVEKGLFSAMLYNYAIKLLNAELTTADVDRTVAIYGASPVFPNTNTASKTQFPDAFSALYAARRDKNDGNGFYTLNRDAFIKLKAAVAAGKDYEAERKEAIATIKANWEKSSAATVINYCKDGRTKIALNTDADNASALHSLSEAVGFTLGWKQVAQSDRIITDAQIDEVLALLNAEDGKTSTFYLFVTDGPNQIQKLQTVIEKLQSIYGFTAEQVNDFGSNWITVQSR